MSRRNTLARVTGLVAVFLLLAGCGPTEAAPTATVAAGSAAATSTPAPTPTPTQSATSTATVAPTPAQTATPTLTPKAIPISSPTATPTERLEPTEVAPVAILEGQFKDADSVHKGSGTATIHRRLDGSYLLSFEDFAVCCGPDLYVFLASNPSPSGYADLGDYLELSSLQASTGDQEYEIPADTDLSPVKSVVIYCKPFEVIISTATLRAR